MARFRVTFHPTRDTILFVVGLAGIVYEAVVSGTDRPTLLILYAAMVGLPAFLRSDEKMSSKDTEVQKKPNGGEREVDDS